MREGYRRSNKTALFLFFPRPRSSLGRPDRTEARQYFNLGKKGGIRTCLDADPVRGADSGLRR